MALSGLFGALSYHFYGTQAEAESALVVAIDANTSLQKSLNLQVESCKISDTITSEYQSEKQVQQDKAQATISKIDSLPKKVSIQDVPKVAPDAEIDIDSALPSDLVRMLSESCLPDEGDTCVPTK
jgi:hypothetical protein